MQDADRGLGLLVRHRPRLAHLAQGVTGELQRNLSGFDRDTCFGELPLQLLDLGADHVTQHFEPGKGLFRFHAGRRGLLLALLEIAPRFVLPGKLPLPFGQRQAQLVGGLLEPDLRVAIMIQLRFDGGQRLGRSGQAQVGGIRRELFVHGLECLFGLAAPHIRFGKPFTGQARGAGAGGGGQVSAAQHLVGGRLAPFFVGLLAVQRDLPGRGLHRGQFVGKLRQALGNLGQPPRAGRVAGCVSDIDRLRLAPGTGQGAETISAVGGDPGLGVDRVVIRAGDAGQHALDDIGRHRTAGRHGDFQKVGKRWRRLSPFQHLRVV